MALLLNRNSSRLECLYYILQATYKNYENTDFSMSDMKFDNDKVNTTDTCQLLSTKLNRKFCPFLDNPLDQSYCYATKSIYSDSTKSKNISDVVRSLEALGFVKPYNKSFIISDLGLQWIQTPFNTKEWLELSRNAVLSYSLVIGLLALSQELGNPFNSFKIYLGYPDTSDPLDLSTGSTRDTNTRTVSKIINWCISTGLIEPAKITNSGNDLPQIYYRDYVNSPRLTERLYKLTQYCIKYIESNPYVDNPLSYSHLNKNVGSLREQGSKAIRETTIKYNKIILNRRFILIYALNKARRAKKELPFDKLVHEMEKYYDNFFIEGSDTFSIMQSESNIATVAGIPFKVNEASISLIPQASINESVLTADAPEEIIKLAKKIVGDLI